MMIGQSNQEYNVVVTAFVTFEFHINSSHHAEIKHFTIKSSSVNNTFYIVKFPNRSSALAATSKNSRIIGTPEYTDQMPLYLSSDLKSLFYLNLFRTSAFTNAITFEEYDAIATALKSVYNVKELIKSHLKGNRLTLGYNKSANTWVPMSSIYSQADVGGVFTMRITDNTNIHNLIKKLNEKFPEGKKG